MQYPNVIIPGKGPLPAIDVQSSLRDSVVTWADLQMDSRGMAGAHSRQGRDYRRRCAGARSMRALPGLIVSNHGGRQLDTCHPTARALPEVLEAVNGRAEVFVDGGIRRGADIVKAICMGAKAVLIGRAYGYGLAAGGQAGVARAIAILKADIERTLVLLGCASVSRSERLLHQVAEVLVEISDADLILGSIQSSVARSRKRLRHAAFELQDLRSQDFE